jgi:ribosomal protein S18 acetylase RimI-like enzyme
MVDPASAPYRAECYAIGDARDGRALSLAPIAATSAESLGRAVSEIGPWAHYGRSPEQVTQRLLATGDGVARYQVMCGAEIAGVIAIQREWLLGPNLQMLAVLPLFQKVGIGARILDWYEAEARTANARNIWLCVSGFNNGAIRFYVRHGFEMKAVLDSLLRRGDDELLMRKQLEG